MRRREFLFAGAAGALAAGAPAALARSGKPVKIGMLSVRPLKESFFASRIVQGLAELGYKEGAGMLLEFRSSNAVAETEPGLAKELVDLKCDLIFVIGSESTARAMRAQRTSIPVVLLAVDFDPVAKGIVASLRKPGGNITGISVHFVGAKRLEILREVVPSATRFLTFEDVASRDQVAILRKTAESLRVSLTVVQFSTRPYDLEAAFKRGLAEGAQGVVLPSSPVLAAELHRLVELASRHRLPAIGFVGSADAGFLMSYSTDNRIIARRSAELGVRILKGAKPAETPMEQPDAFEMVINRKTAHALGVKIPPAVAARANRLIE